MRLLKTLLISSYFFCFSMATFPFVYGQSDTFSIHHSSHPDHPEYLQDSLQIENWYTLNWRYYWEGKFDSMSIISHEIIDLATKWMKQDTFFSISYHYANTNLGNVLCIQGYYAEGIPKFKAGMQAMANYQDNDDAAFFLSTSYIGLGRIYEFTGYLEKALECYLEADRIQTKLVKAGKLGPGWLAYKANYLADIYYKMGQLEETEKLFHRAIKINSEVPVACRFDRYHVDLAALYVRIGDHKKARDLMDSLESFFAIGDCSHTLYLEFLFNKTLADAYFDIDSYSIAGRFYKKALEIAEIDHRVASEQEANAVPISYYQLSRIYLNYNQLDTARKYLEMAKSAWLADNNQTHEFWNQLMTLEGEINFNEGNWSAALDRFHGVLDQYIPNNWLNTGSLSPQGVTEWPFSPRIMQALRGRIKVLTAQWKQDPESIDFDDLLREITAGQQYLEHFLQTYTTEHDKGRIFKENRALYNIPIDLLEKKHQSTGDEKYLDQLFYFFEKSKALQLLSVVKDRQLQTSFGVPEDLREKERSIRRETGFYKKQIGSIFRSEKDSTDLKLHYQDLLTKLQSQSDSLQMEIKNNFPGYHRLKYDLSVVSLATVKKNLPSGQGILTYFWGTEKLFVLGITKEKTSIWAVPLDDQFKNQLDNFINAITHAPGYSSPSGKDNSWLQDGWQIYRQLIEPIAAEDQNIQNWVFIPDGKLAYLPWAALPFDNKNFDGGYRNFPFLVKKFSLQQEYSVTLFFTEPISPSLPLDYVGIAPDYPGEQHLSNRKLDTLQLQYAFGENFRQGYQSLLYNQPEVAHAVAYYANGVKLIGRNANESRFKNYAQKGNILHLAMHAYTNDVDPMLSHLAFTPKADSLEDGFLYAYELYNLNIPAELTILSACNTGNGVLHDGQGVMSLARAFKYAGCQNVLMTLWPAHDRSTSTIISTFFDRLQSQNSKAGALQLAMLDYLQNEPNGALLHPHYWSGFTLIGSDEVVSQKAFDWWWVLIIPGLIVFVIRMRHR